MSHNRNRILRVISVGSLIAFVVLYLLSLTLMSSAGGRVSIYFILCLLATCALVTGTNTIRVIGAAALLFAVVLLVMDYRSGNELLDRVHAVKQAASTRSASQGSP